MKRLRLTLVVGVVAAAGGVAHANGRPPQSRNIHFRPGNTSEILLPVTFGAMISQDDGAHYHWICEESVGYGGMYDPDYSIATDGSIFSTTFDGLRVSTDDGCTWTNVPGPWLDDFVADVEIDSQGRVWAIASSTDRDGVYVSVNDGATFTRTALDHPGAFWGAIRIAESDPDRVYVSGFEVPAGGGRPIPLLYTSANAGDSWTQRTLTGVTLGSVDRVAVAAVSPTNPSVVLLIVPNAVNNDMGDALYRSTDAGATFTNVLEMDSPILAIGYRLAGTTAYAGTIEHGFRRSDDGGATWITPAQQLEMACVGERSDGVVFACGENGPPDNGALFRSTDGINWTVDVAFGDLVGPLECPTSTVQYQTCQVMRWCTQAPLLGVDDPACPDTDAGPTTDAAVQPDAGSGGGGNGCGGCSVLVGVAVMGAPWRRRRRERERERGSARDECAR